MSPSREQMEADGTIAEMVALRDEGKVRFLGISGLLPNLPQHLEMDVFEVFQIPYSAVQREHEQLITRAAEAGAGVLVRGGAARGAPSDDKAWGVPPIGLGADDARKRWDEGAIDDLLDGMSRMEFTLRFTLSHPGLSSTIVGTSRMAHWSRTSRSRQKAHYPPTCTKRPSAASRAAETNGGLAGECPTRPPRRVQGGRSGHGSTPAGRPAVADAASTSPKKTTCVPPCVCSTTRHSSVASASRRSGWPHSPAIVSTPANLSALLLAK